MKLGGLIILAIIVFIISIVFCIIGKGDKEINVLGGKATAKETVWSFIFWAVIIVLVIGIASLF